VSRIGKAPVQIPKGVKVSYKDGLMKVEGPLGSLQYQFNMGITAELEESIIHIKRENDTRQQRALHGLTRALVNNMVTGVSAGFEKILHVIGTGYNAEKIGPWVKLAIGFSHDILLQIPKGVTVDVEAVPRSKGTKADLNSIIRIKGINKEDIGKFAAEVRACRPPENYKGKGVRYAEEYVIIKAGKAGSK
jgi:large subunit ribosomal protein L6